MLSELDAWSELWVLYAAVQAAGGLEAVRASRQVVRTVTNRGATLSGQGATAVLANAMFRFAATEAIARGDAEVTLLNLNNIAVLT